MKNAKRILLESYITTDSAELQEIYAILLLKLDLGVR